MTTMTTIRPGRPEDLHAIGTVLAHAFDEPVTHWLVPDPARRSAVMPPFFTELAGDALADGLVDVVLDGFAAEDDVLLGAAVWFDLTRDHPPTDATPGPAGEPRWGQIFGPDAERWTLLDDLMTRHHLTDPHWYLMAIGVRPDAQRRGLGSQLLMHRHRHLDDVAYLEATTLDSRRLYRRHGYTDLGELRIPGGPPMWQMVRPRAATADVTAVGSVRRTPVA